MGVEIDKYNSTNNAQELAEIYRLQQEGNKNTDKVNNQKVEEKPDTTKKQKANLDTYVKSSAVSDSIEQQIKEQKEKIAEISKNLEGLQDDYYNTLETENSARADRAKKERDLYQKEVSERSLKRIFQNWQRKHTMEPTDKEVLGEFQTHRTDYNTASDEERAAQKAYNLSDTAAYSAISDHNSADSAYLSGLWSKEDAYWDLAKMQQRYAFAKMKEYYNNK